MSAFLVQFALSNLVLSAILAGAAYAVHRRGRYPVLAHLLWVLVLVKLVTPPLFSLPLVPIPGWSRVTAQPAVAVTSAAPSGLESGSAWLIEHGLPVLLLAWALGSMVVLVASMLRIYRFDRLLRQTSSEAPAGIQWLARDVAWQIELRSVPTIYTAQARLSPMTWWAGGPVRIVIPATLPDHISGDQLRWVLAHELAHVKRRDHLVRWLEWIACVSFWWNPVAWWARRNLRFAEEASCDALVLDRLGPQPRSYAAALLVVVELLSGPALHPPPVATGIDGGGSLEMRFRMIISGHPARRVPRWLVAGMVVASLVLMPLGVGGATDPDGSDVPKAAAGAGMVGLQTVAFSQPELAFLSLDGRTRTTVGVGAVADAGEHALLSANTTRRSSDLVPKQTTKVAQAKKVKSARLAAKKAARQAAKKAARQAAKKAARQADATAASAVAPSGGQGSGGTQGPLGRILRS